MDHEGYGRSSRSERNSDVAMAVEDLDHAMQVIKSETGRNKAHFYGQSGGALRAAFYAQTRPNRVEKLVLDAFVWTGQGTLLWRNAVNSLTNGDRATSDPSTVLSCTAYSRAIDPARQK